MPRCWEGHGTSIAHPSRTCLLDGQPFIYRAPEAVDTSVLCLTQKAGSSTWKLALLKAVGANGFPDSNGHFETTPHGWVLPFETPSQAEWTRLSHGSSTRRFMIVRAPHARLLSGYLDKVVPQLRDHPEVDGFGGFVRAIVADPHPDGHFELQSQKCGLPEGIQYEYLRLEEEAEWYPRLACELRIEAALTRGWATPSTWNRGGSECFAESSCGCELSCEDASQSRAPLPCAPTAAAANIGGLFITDVTNASRWLFMDLHTLKWDKVLIDTVCGHDGSLSDDGVSIPLSALPDIKSSSEVYGRCAIGFGEPAIEGTPIAGILGDQQAALFGQGAFEAGEAKNTYGTGLFLMMNTGTQPTPSTHGLLTTVGYCLGNEKPVYALEGSVSHSGSTIQWLRDQLQIIDDASESEIYARKVDSNDGMYFVPAFAGLFAPYWKSDARACIVGMTASHNKNHFCRAALESAAYQTKDVFDAINVDSHVPLKELRVDGGGTANSLLMQFTADMTNVPVIKPVVKETTALGAAYAAGLAVGVWKDTKEIKSLWAEEERFVPSMDSKLREKYLKGWKKAIQKSMGWVDGDDQID